MNVCDGVWGCGGGFPLFVDRDAGDGGCCMIPEKVVQGKVMNWTCHCKDFHPFHDGMWK